MAHRLYDWIGRIKAASREYQVMRVALDFLESATEDEIHELAESRKWDDFIRVEINTADLNLDATYLFRMYSAFEMAVDSFWRQLTGNKTLLIVSRRGLGLVLGCPSCDHALPYIIDLEDLFWRWRLGAARGIRDRFRQDVLLRFEEEEMICPDG